MLLEVRNLCSSFFLDEGELRAVDDVTFDIGTSERVALVGESGCGKTIVALSLIQLIAPPGRVKSGEVRFDGQDLLPGIICHRFQIRKRYELCCPGIIDQHIESP